MKVEEIVALFLRSTGHDGLVDGECACSLNELMECAREQRDCVAGHAHEVNHRDEGADYLMYPGKCDEECGFYARQKEDE